MAALLANLDKIRLSAIGPLPAGHLSDFVSDIPMVSALSLELTLRSIHILKTRLQQHSAMTGHIFDLDRVRENLTSHHCQRRCPLPRSGGDVIHNIHAQFDPAEDRKA